MLRTKTKRTLVYVTLILLTFLSISPLIWIFLTAFKIRKEIFAIPPVWIPKPPTLSHFITIFTGGFSRTPFIYNSIIISLSTTALALVIATMAAYGFAKYKVPRSKDIEFWILSTRMMPPIAVVIPLFLLFRNIGLLDTKRGLIAIYIAFNLPFAVWMMSIFFRQLPREIEEAAVIDGCSVFNLLRYISLPLVASGLAVVAIFTFYFTWNELLFALILTNRIAKTFPVSISEFRGVVNIRWGPMAASSIIHIAPVIVITFLIQKYIIAGLTLGAVKR